MQKEPEPAAGLGQDHSHLNAFTLERLPSLLSRYYPGGVRMSRTQASEQSAWAEGLALSHFTAICVILGQGPALSKPQFLLLHKGLSDSSCPGME